QTIRHKLGVLRRHCEEVGRDPSSITTTRLGGLVIAPSAREAEQIASEAAARRGTDLDEYRRYAVVGDPDAVLEQARAYLDAGLDGLIFNMPNAHELEPVRLAGATLSALYP